MALDLIALRHVNDALNNSDCCSRDRNNHAGLAEADLKALGLGSPPHFWESGVGIIMPISGRQSTCIWLYERLSGAKIKAQDGKMPEACALALDTVRKLIQEAEAGGSQP